MTAAMAIVVMTAALATAIVEEMVKGKAMVALVLLVEETAGWILSAVRAVVASVVVDGVIIVRRLR